MAGTAGSGGLGALGMGGIAAAAVVAGGVVAYLTGVFGADDLALPVEKPAAVAPANGNSAPAVSPVQETSETPAPSEQAQAQPEETAPASALAPAETEEDQPDIAAAQAVETAPAAETDAAETAPAPDEAAQEDTVSEPVSGPAAETATAQETPAPAEDGNGTATAAATAEDVAGDAAATAEEPAGAPAPAAEEPEPAEQPAAVAAEEAAPAAVETAFVLAAPELDTVRFEPDGSGLIAGRAAPGAKISVLLDADVLDQFTVDGSGQFVAFVAAPPSEAQRVLTLMASLDGQTVASDASFILGATRVPVVVAEAEPSKAGEAAAVDAPSDEVPAEQPSAEGTAVAEAPAENAADQPSGAGEAPAETETPAAVAVLRADSSGITVVQPAANGPAGAVALDTLSYGDAGDVEIAGRAKAEAALRVYVNNKPAGDLLSSADGTWSVSLEGIAPGNYTLRVDEINAQGIVLSRVETPFTREAPEVLAEAAPEADPQAPEPLLRAITVRKGDSLWAISRKAYGDGRLYVRLFDANRNEIRNPDLIYPGQVFALPE